MTKTVSQFFVCCQKRILLYSKTVSEFKEKFIKGIIILCNFETNYPDTQSQVILGI